MLIKTENFFERALVKSWLNEMKGGHLLLLPTRDSSNRLAS